MFQQAFCRKMETAAAFSPACYLFQPDPKTVQLLILINHLLVLRVEESEFHLLSRPRSKVPKEGQITYQSRKKETLPKRPECEFFSMFPPQ